MCHQWSVVLKNTVYCAPPLSRRVLGYRLGALTHGVLGKLTRQHEPHGSLDLP